MPRHLRWTSPNRSGSSCLLILLLFLIVYVHPVYSIPQHLRNRQSSLSSLQLPKCALTCYLSGILEDGCANEADFTCHCANGNVIGRAKACIEQGCDAEDEKKAFSKMRSACSAFGGGGSSSGGGGTGDATNPRASSASLVESTTMAAPSTVSSTGAVSPIPTQLATSTPSVGNIQSTPVLSLSRPESSLSTTARSSTRSASPTPPMPTTPLALLPPSDQLSAGAKAGIAVSVSFVAISVIFGLGWYIRRLKRDLKVAQAAARASGDWQFGKGPAGAAGGVSRNLSSRSTASIRGRRRSRGGDSPVSPLSPRNMSMGEVTTVTNNGYGVLKKKRGHVLSVVVEGEEEDNLPILDGVVHEPVPGQREGLSVPLELDGQWTGVVELPLAITPRNRSLERQLVKVEITSKKA